MRRAIAIGVTVAVLGCAGAASAAVKEPTGSVVVHVLKEKAHAASARHLGDYHLVGEREPNDYAWQSSLVSQTLGRSAVVSDLADYDWYAFTQAGRYEIHFAGGAYGVLRIYSPMFSHEILVIRSGCYAWFQYAANPGAPGVVRVDSLSAGAIPYNVS